MNRKAALAAIFIVLVFGALPLATVYWVVYTQSGLRFAFSQLTVLNSIVRIRADGVRGDLASGFHIDRLSIDHERVLVLIDGIDSRIRPRSLLLQTVDVVAASADKVYVEIRPRRHLATDRPLRFLPSFLRVVANRAHVAQVEILLQNGYRIRAAKAGGDAVLSSRHLAVKNLSVDGGYYSANGTFDMGAADPLQLAGDLHWTLRVADQPPWTGSLQAHGDLNELVFQAKQSAPIAADIAGRGLTLTQDWHWQATIVAAQIDFARLAPAAKFAAADIALNVEGDRTGMVLKGALTPTLLPTGRLEIGARGPYPSRRIVLNTVTILGGGSRIDANGSIDFTHGGPALDFRGTLAQFRWPMQRPALLVAKSAVFTLQGQQLPYAYTLAGNAGVLKLPPFELRAAGQLARDGVSIDNAKVNWLNGVIAARGRVDFASPQKWTIAVTGKDLNPAAIDPRWPGRLALGATIEGSGFGAGAPLAVRLARLAGTLRREPLLASGGLQREERNLRFTKLAARFANATLDADGTIGAVNTLSVSLQAPQLQRVLPTFAGALSIQARLFGPAATARLAASIDGHGLKVSQLNIARIHGSADVDLADRQGSQLDLSADGVQIAALDLGDIRAKLAGRASAHTFTLKSAGLLQIDSAFNGSYAAGAWRGSVSSLSLRSGTDVDVHLAAPSNLNIAMDALKVESLCLVGQNERVCAQGDWRRLGAWNVNAHAIGIPLRALGANFPAKPQYTGTLAFDVNLHATGLADITGQASFDLDNGTLRYQLPSGREGTLRLGSGRGELLATTERVLARLHVAATDATFLDVKASGARRADQPLLKTLIAGTIHSQADELGFIPLLVPQIDRATGRIEADLAVSGTLGEPQFDGAVILRDGQIDLYQVNLLMREINARVDVAANALKVDGHAKIGTGNAQATGEFAWVDRKPQGNIKLVGERLLMVNIPELQAEASPNLDFKIDGQRIDVGGSVTIPSARLRPADLTGAAMSSGDEVIVGEQAIPADQRLQVYTSIKLVLGSSVNVETYGLKGRLTGSVTASSDPAGNARGSGELNIEEGKYTAYGRQLDIQHGRLMFTGGMVGDPAVDLRAVKVFPDVTAGVNVRGKLRNPQISFFSDPSLPQSQIVSVLVAGGTLESLQSGGTAQVGQARNELLAQGGAIVAQQLGARLGVEDVGLESDTLNQTSLVLGKFLNPRLYVSYGISLSESINTVKMRYTLGDHWTIRTEAGEYRGSDLVYTIER